MPDPVVTPAPAPAPAPSSSTPAPSPATAPAITPAPTPAPAPTTLADGAIGTAPPVVSSTAFPDNWRGQIAGEDKGALERLNRFASPNDLFKSYRELETKISSGQLKAPPQPLPANATDEQKAQWRQTNGLPDKPEAYVEKLALPNGVVIGEAEKPLVNEFAKDMFAAGASQDEMNRAMASYFRLQGAAVAQRAEQDGASRTQSQTTLMSEWGPGDYKVNMNAVGSLLAGMPEEFRVALLTARTPQGQMLGDTVGFNKWAAAHAREVNPAATLISPTEGNAPKAIADEIEAISVVYRKAVQGDGDARRAYYGADGKPGLDARQRELIGAQQTMAARGQRAA